MRKFGMPYLIRSKRASRVDTSLVSSLRSLNIFIVSSPGFIARTKIIPKTAANIVVDM